MSKIQMNNNDNNNDNNPLIPGYCRRIDETFKDEVQISRVLRRAKLAEDIRKKDKIFWLKNKRNHGLKNITLNSLSCHFCDEDIVELCTKDNIWLLMTIKTYFALWWSQMASNDNLALLWTKELIGYCCDLQIRPVEEQLKQRVIGERYCISRKRKSYKCLVRNELSSPSELSSANMFRLDESLWGMVEYLPITDT